MTNRFRNLMRRITDNIEFCGAPEIQLYAMFRQLQDKGEDISQEVLQEVFSHSVAQGYMESARFFSEELHPIPRLHLTDAVGGVQRAIEQDTLQGGHPENLVAFMYAIFPSQSAKGVEFLVSRANKSLEDCAFDFTRERLENLGAYVRKDKTTSKTYPVMGVELMRRELFGDFDALARQAQGFLDAPLEVSVTEAKETSLNLSKKVCVARSLLYAIDRDYEFEEIMKQEHREYAQVRQGRSSRRDIMHLTSIPLLVPLEAHVRYVLGEAGKLESHLRLLVKDPTNYHQRALEHEEERFQALINDAISNENYRRAAALIKHKERVRTSRDHGSER